jgi:cellulose synthase operon protein YhjQ
LGVAKGMDEFSTNPTEPDEVAPEPETPEDVAVLYTWANVHGIRYRDFSASRREYRAQQRYRMVEAQRQAELDAARTLEEKAARELEEARQLESGTSNPAVSPAEAEEIRRRTEQRSQERLAAQRHVETAEELRLALEEAERELEEARRRSEEQAARYADADARWRAQQSGMAQVVPGHRNAPDFYPAAPGPNTSAPGSAVRSSSTERVLSERRADSYALDRGENGARAVPLRAEMAGNRPQVPEESHEHHGPEELDHRTATSGGGSDDGGDHDQYFSTVDTRWSSPGTRLPSDGNSTPNDVHMLPHHEHPDAEAGNRSGAHSEDPATGKPHTLEPPRIRRRESATDTLARTTRRPRLSGDSTVPDMEGEHAMHSPEPDGRTQPSLPAAPQQRRRYEPEASARSRRDAGMQQDSNGIGLPAVGAEGASQLPRVPYDNASQPAVSSPVPATYDGFARREERPAWLGREARATDRNAGSPDNRYDGDWETEGTRRERDAFEEFLSRSVDPVSWSSGDRPARSSYLERDDRRDDRQNARADTRSTSEPEDFQEDHPDPRELPRILPDRDDSQMVRADDGGLNLRPLQELPPMDKLPPLRDLTPLRDLPRMRGRSGYREEGDEVRSTLNAPVEDTSSVPGGPVPYDIASEEQFTASGFAGDVPQGISHSEGDIAWPRVERRRYERSSTRGVGLLLDNSRDYRPASSTKEELEEKTVRTRSHAARRDVQLREQFRKETESPFPADPVALDHEEPAVEAQDGLSAGSPPDTLQQSRERVAARWFALKGLMGANVEPVMGTPPQFRSVRETTAPMLAVVALSGGVGKTSMVATLGRALSSVGEKVLLVDTTAHGLLPYYFGARELRPDVVRTFSPPPGSADAPVYLVTYETDRLAADPGGQARLVDEIGRNSKGAQRVLVDLNGSSAWVARQLARYNSSVLVPIAPDVNSVLSIRSVERFFAGTHDSEGRPISPYYVLSQFDASLPLHLDVREVLRQQLGNRLLPVIIRRSQSVAEALAEGMTVFDYAPESPITEDYIQLAEWVRNLAAPAGISLRSIRWSER